MPGGNLYSKEKSGLMVAGEGAAEASHAKIMSLTNFKQLPQESKDSISDGYQKLKNDF